MLFLWGSLLKFSECWGNSADFIDISGDRLEQFMKGILKLDTDKNQEYFRMETKYGINDAIRTMLTVIKL